MIKNPLKFGKNVEQVRQEEEGKFQSECWAKMLTWGLENKLVVKPIIANQSTDGVFKLVAAVQFIKMDEKEEMATKQLLEKLEKGE